MPPVLPALRSAFRLGAMTACAALLAACAPAVTVSTSGPAPQGAGLRAAFSDQGVAWVSGGVACVARAPAYRASCPKLPPVVDVAWHDAQAWAAVPASGLIVTLDLTPRTVNVGRVAALSGTRVYREDGSAVNYAGERVAGVLGTPAAALTGGDGADYVVLGGMLRRLSDGLVVEGAVQPYLAVTPAGVRSSAWPEVSSPYGTYRLTGTVLQRVDTTGRVVGSVPHGPALIGLVGAQVVTVAADGVVHVYGVDLVPL